MAVHPDGKVDLLKVRYTTCPVGNQDWMLQASSINLDTNEQEGTAHGVVMRFKDIPIFYRRTSPFPWAMSARAVRFFRASGIRPTTAGSWRCRTISIWRQITI